MIQDGGFGASLKSVFWRMKLFLTDILGWNGFILTCKVSMFDSFVFSKCL